MLAFITGSGLYDHHELEPLDVQTPHGPAAVWRGEWGGRDILMLPRHGEGHRCLPNHLNPLAHFAALRQLGATAVVSCSVCGLLDPHIPLGTPLAARDIYFPENRLPDGSICTLFREPGDPARGHLLATNLINAPLADAIRPLLGSDTADAVYGHVNGPRFNTVSEIRALRHAGVEMISQTCGPEAVLANELEWPYALLGFGIDYANGVRDTPTPVEVLDKNLAAAQRTFLYVIEHLREPEKGFPFQNLVYRFE